MNKLFCLLSLLFCCNLNALADPLLVSYQKHYNQENDIKEHLPRLRKLARECSAVTEIGIRSVVSTWAVLLGLSESEAKNKYYTGIDIARPPEAKLKRARVLSAKKGIKFNFIELDDRFVTPQQTDLLFIDSLHTYCHLTLELEKFSPYVTKYIALHDTSAPWDTIDDTCYTGDYSEYPAHYDRTKRGLWPAVEDFLERHPEWELHERFVDYHGFTVLKRVE